MSAAKKPAFAAQRLSSLTHLIRKDALQAPEDADAMLTKEAEHGGGEVEPGDCRGWRQRTGSMEEGGAQSRVVGNAGRWSLRIYSAPRSCRLRDREGRALRVGARSSSCGASVRP